MEVKSRSEDPFAHRRYEMRPRPQSASFPPTFPSMVKRSAMLFGERVFLPRRHSRGGEPVTFRQLASDVERLAAGLVARGIGHGDRVGLMSENRYEWLLADLATMFFGAIDVPRGVDTAPAEMRFILEHSGCRCVFVENDDVAREMVHEQQHLPQLQTIFSLQETSAVPGVIALPELLAQGDAWLAVNPQGVELLSERVGPQDVATIVYTSGTTEDPKGVVLTHDNILSNVRTANMVFDFGQEDRFLSILPPWHVYERMMDYVAVCFGAEMVYTDRRRLKEDLAAVKPTLLAAVPRIWESLHDGIVSKCQQMSGARRSIMDTVLRCCRRIGAGKPKLVDLALHPLLRATVLRRFRTLTGGRLRIAVSGGGALPQHVDQTLVGLGFPLLNGYGLTETSPVVSVRDPKNNRCGTVGPPLPETEVQIRARDGRPARPGEVGEIWIRGPGVMRGYFKNAERTAGVLQDGWFYSGDLGSMDEHGHVSITGRAKDTIVLAGGENVEPERVEAALKVSPLIDQAVVLGQDRKCLGALLVVAADVLEQRLPRERWGLEGNLLTSRDVHALFRQELDSLLTRKNGFRPVERIASFRVLHEPMTAENGFLTPTLKVKRRMVEQRYKHIIDDMFAG